MGVLFFIKDGTGKNDGSVHYNGKVLPRDAKKPLTSEDTGGNPTDVNYNGRELPRDKKAYVPPLTDLTNYPQLVIIGNVVMPPDTAIYINGQKTLAVSKILDGVSVVERVMRQPYEIEFECVVRAQDGAGNYIFPQDALDDLWFNVWIPDTVQTVQNTYLNKLGVQEIVIDSISPTTLRGSTNIPLRIRAYENVPGQTIIVIPT